MTKAITINTAALDLALQEMKEAAARCAKQPQAVSSICTAVANLIAGAGPFGGSEQTRLMDLANSHGFRPEFYSSSIRVHWEVK